jgi:predicted HTH transcriptional regulator
VPQDSIVSLKKLVAEGEGWKLEFKRKASHPEKIVREMIAFANTHGGTLLIGVDDNGSLPGVKFPREEIHVIQEALKKYVRPVLSFSESTVAVSNTHVVVRLEIPISDKRPHYFKQSPAGQESYVRHKDMSVKASAEMCEIIRRKRLNKDIRFNFGEPEKELMVYLEQHGTITLAGFRKLARLNRFQAARKLILLVLGDVLTITPTEKGDLYSRR